MKATGLTIRKGAGVNTLTAITPKGTHVFDFNTMTRDQKRTVGQALRDTANTLYGVAV